MICCVGCGEQFSPTGKGHRCLVCRREYDKAWRAKRTAQGLPARGAIPTDYMKTYSPAYHARADVRARKAAQMREYSRLPDVAHKQKARRVTRDAVAKGVLERQPCELCGSVKVEAHHVNYDNPLDVRWLCKPHHRELHAKAGGR